MWMALKHDWIGFLNFVHARFIRLDHDMIPCHGDGPGSFLGHLARAGHMTVPEAEELLEALILPAWFSDRFESAAA